MSEPTFTPPDGSEESLVVCQWWLEVLRRRCEVLHKENRRLERELRYAREGSTGQPGDAMRRVA